jgi:hypothetical protein
MEHRSIYPDRFDTDYLAFLESELDIKKLKAGALYEKKPINDVEYHRCISIDFCGIAASTLFFTDASREDITPENLEARKRVAAAFKKLFEQNELLALNNENEEERFYIRARFCFSYMHSDYPICLMKAEQKEIWEKLADKPIDDYYISKPVNGSDFRKSKIRSTQEDSLRAIADILDNNEELIIMGGLEKKVNTIQVRFCAIPSTVCTLIINNIAYCDPYLYAKLEPNKQLALNYPVLVLREDDDDMPKAFAAIRKHVNYLWRHDLTLFCKDATRFRPDNHAGLVELLPPEAIIGFEGTNWLHKETRIWEKKKELDNTLFEKTERILQKISEWKANLNYKLGLGTKKVKEEGDDSETANMEVTVGMRRNFYYFKIACSRYNILFEYLQPTPNTLYCALAHYSYTRLTAGKIPVMHECTSAKNILALKNTLIDQLNNYDLDKNNNGTRYFDHLFSTNPVFELKLTTAQIHFGFSEINQIKQAEYPTHYGKSKSCLDFELPYRKR